jgi:hypothetical protein
VTSAQDGESKRTEKEISRKKTPRVTYSESSPAIDLAIVSESEAGAVTGSDFDKDSLRRKCIGRDGSGSCFVGIETAVII